MTARRNVLSLARSAAAAGTLFVKDIGQGLLVVSHNTLALLGLAVVAVLLMFSSQADLRHKLETEAFGWLNARQEARVEASGNTLMGLAAHKPLAAAGVNGGGPPRRSKGSGRRARKAGDGEAAGVRRAG